MPASGKGVVEDVGEAPGDDTPEGSEATPRPAHLPEQAKDSDRAGQEPPVRRDEDETVRQAVALALRHSPQKCLATQRCETGLSAWVSPEDEADPHVTDFAIPVVEKMGRLAALGGRRDLDLYHLFRA